MRFQKNTILPRFEKINFLHFQIAVFKNAVFQTIYVLRFGLKLHLLSTKLQFQTHP